MLDQVYSYGIIYGCSAFGILWGLINIYLVSRVDMTDSSHLVRRKQEGEEEGLLTKEKAASSPEEREETLKQMIYISDLIKDGAISFLKQEYLYLSVFILLFAILLVFTVEPQLGTFYTTTAFLIGATTSILSGYIGMRIAVYTNVRTTKECATDISNGFIVAYRGGQVLGFVLVGLALMILISLIIVYKTMLVGDSTNIDDAENLFEMITGYGLGGSTVALFGRVGGGIYTKAADVGSDLAGKVIQGLDEDDPSNPGVIADNVGDNVGDIAGMGSDLFGSLAEATCAALVVSSTSAELVNTTDAIYFPLVVTSCGIVVSFLTTLLATNAMDIRMDTVERVIKVQLLASSLLLTGVLYPCIYLLPSEFSIVDGSSTIESTALLAYGCILFGLWTGLIIGFITEYYTSGSYTPVQTLAESCRMGPAPNIILGLALGYMSNVVPIVFIAVTIYFAFSWAGMYGIALAALGMLGCLPIALSIDGYGPISDNAGGIAEMAQLDKSVRAITDKLDAAGNTTAAIGKGFAIGSACLVALALFGAYVTRTEIEDVNILTPIAFSCLLLGAMLPYFFSSLTMSAVGLAANEMIAEIKRQMNTEQYRQSKKPDYDACISISTRASLKKMIAPGLLVILTPLVIGFCFGVDAVCGLLAGTIVSGVQVAISMSNSGGAWDNAKKYIEAGTHYSTLEEAMGDEDEDGRYLFMKKSQAHMAAVVGDTVGDPLKDTSGPSNNILIKLSAITSLVFGSFFLNSGGILLGSKATSSASTL